MSDECYGKVDGKGGTLGRGNKGRKIRQLLEALIPKAD